MSDLKEELELTQTLFDFTKGNPNSKFSNYIISSTTITLKSKSIGMSRILRR